MLDWTILDQRIRRAPRVDLRTIEDVDQTQMLALTRLDVPTTVRALCGMLSVPLAQALECLHGLAEKDLVIVDSASPRVVLIVGEP